MNRGIRLTGEFENKREVPLGSEEWSGESQYIHTPLQVRNQF